MGGLGFPHGVAARAAPPPGPQGHKVLMPPLRAVPRELLPLPFVDEAKFCFSPAGGRRSAQRCARRRACARGTNELVAALNFLNGQGELEPWRRPSEAQRAVLSRLATVVQEDSPPSPPTDGQAALAELLANRASSYLDCGDVPSSVASYDPALVSRPESAGGVSLVEPLPEAERAILTVGREQLFRPVDVYKGEAETRCVFKAYWDERLRVGGPEYRDFVLELQRRNMISFRLAVEERVGIFFVRKNLASSEWWWTPDVPITG